MFLLFQTGFISLIDFFRLDSDSKCDFLNNHVYIFLGWIQALCFTSDGVYLGSACEDDTVRVWDVVDGKCVKVLEVRQLG